MLISSQALFHLAQTVNQTVLQVSANAKGRRLTIHLEGGVALMDHQRNADEHLESSRGLTLRNFCAESVKA